MCSGWFFSLVKRVSGNLNCLRNRSKLVEGILFAKIALTDLLIGAKSITFYTITRVRGEILTKISK